MVEYVVHAIWGCAGARDKSMHSRQLLPRALREKEELWIPHPTHPLNACYNTTIRILSVPMKGVTINAGTNVCTSFSRASEGPQNIILQALITRLI